MANLSIADQLQRAERTFDNSKESSTITERMVAYGYDVAVMTAGRDMHKAARTSVELQKIALGELDQARETVQRTRATAHANYRAVVDLIRAIFEDDQAAIVKLGIPSAFPDTISDFISAATTLFANLERLPDLAARIPEAAYPTAQRTSDRASIAAYDDAESAVVRATAQSKSATTAQADALAALKTWLNRYDRFARLALAAHPDLLESIGVQARKARPKRIKERSAAAEYHATSDEHHVPSAEQ